MTPPTRSHDRVQRVCTHGNAQAQKCALKRFCPSLHLNSHDKHTVRKSLLLGSLALHHSGGELHGRLAVVRCLRTRALDAVACREGWRRCRTPDDRILAVFLGDTDAHQARRGADLRLERRPRFAVRWVIDREAVAVTAVVGVVVAVAAPPGEAGREHEVVGGDGRRRKLEAGQEAGEHNAHLGIHCRGPVQLDGVRGIARGDGCHSGEAKDSCEPCDARHSPLQTLGQLSAGGAAGPNTS
mmetsp:Transcript_38391/g.96364  ORF Transcript_38391/g.96364 Transcript_38391/m.96364 type:complete len:241 (-) Transcript_38391:11-733(-)